MSKIQQYGNMASGRTIVVRNQNKTKMVEQKENFSKKKYGSKKIKYDMNNYYYVF